MLGPPPKKVAKKCAWKVPLSPTPNRDAQVEREQLFAAGQVTHSGRRMDGVNFLSWGEDNFSKAAAPGPFE